MVLYRRDWIADTTRFDACRVFMALGRPERFPAQLSRPVQALLGPLDPSCGEDRNPPSVGRLRRVVLLDSIVVNDSTASAYLDIRRGEYLHHETYQLRALGPAQLGRRQDWGLVRVTLTGAVRLTLPRAP